MLDKNRKISRDSQNYRDVALKLYKLGGCLSKLGVHVTAPGLISTICLHLFSKLGLENLSYRAKHTKYDG